MNKLFISLIIGLIQGQIVDPETGKPAELRYDSGSGEYYLFGLDVLNMIDGKSYKGKFIRKTNNLVYFKIEGKGGSILEIEMQNIDSIISENGNAIIDDFIIEKAVKINHQKFIEKTAYENGKDDNLMVYTLSGPIGIIIIGGALIISNGKARKNRGLLAAITSTSLILPPYAIHKLVGINYPKPIYSNSDKKKYKKIYTQQKNKRIVKYVVPGYLVSGLLGGLAYMYFVSTI